MGVFNVFFDRKLVVDLQKILRRPPDEAIDQCFLFVGKMVQVSACLKKVKRLDFQLCRPSAIQRRFVGQHMVLHVRHGRTAENEKKFGSVLVFVDQELKRGSQAFGSPGYIRVLVDNQNDPLRLRQRKHIFQRRLKRRKGGIHRDIRVILQDTPGEVIQILLGVALHASKEDAFFVFDKLADQGRLSHPAAAVDYSELKAVRSIQGIQGLQFSFSSDEHQRTSRRILLNYDLLKYT